MNVQEWLEQATKEMPGAVRDRVSAETLAHLEDAGVREGADVRLVLGTPRAMRRELGRLYVPDRSLGILRRDPSHLSAAGYFLLLLVTYIFPFLLHFFKLQEFRLVENLSHAELLTQAAWLLLGLWFAGLLLTIRLPSERRRLWHENLSAPVLLAGFWLGYLSNFLGGDRPDFLGLILLLLTPVFVCRLMWKAWHEDRRLRRTLALVGGAQL